MELLEKSNKITERFVQLLIENDLDYSDELKIFSKIAEKYNLKYFPSYIKENNLNYNTTNKKVEQGIIPSVEIDGITFILNF